MKLNNLVLIVVVSGGLLPQTFIVLVNCRYQLSKMFFDKFDMFGIVENSISSKIIKNVAGEAQDPSRKMRLEPSLLHRGLKSMCDLYGASYCHFAETNGVEA